MKIQNQVISRRVRLQDYVRFGWPILGLVALLGIAVFLLLADIARDQDATYESNTRNYVQDATKNWIQSNVEISTEFAIWNDAFEKITLGDDQAWMKENFLSINTTAIAVVRPGVGLRYVYVNPESSQSQASVAKLIATLDFSKHDAYRQKRREEALTISPKTLALLGDQLVAVSAQPIRTDDGYSGPELTDSMPTDIAISIRRVDDAAIETMAASFGLIDAKLHIGPEPAQMPADLVHYCIEDAAGNHLGWISWTNLRPGTTAFAKRVLPIFLGLLLAGILTLIVTQRLLASQVALSEAARRSAEEASRTKSNFLANISHELRTPLNAIIGYSELIQEDCADAQMHQAVQDTQKVINSGQHLLALINDLLDHSKIEGGKMDLNPSETELQPLFSSVEDTLKSLIAKNNNQLILNIEPAIGTAYLDGMRLKQCLLNLVSNAAKFTKNGQIIVSARPHDQNNAPFICISVKDTGMGMSEETLAKLFAPFVQAEASTAAKFGGTGLGLAITRALVHAMGGSVNVKSKPGTGSTFTILVPRTVARADNTITALPEISLAA